VSESESELLFTTHSIEWVLSDAHSNSDFPPLMAKKIGLSLNFESNQLKKEISVSKSDPQYLIRIPSSTIIVGQKQEYDQIVDDD
jgi:hypothetical protein